MDPTWEEAVRVALRTGNEEALRELYDELLKDVGSDRASQQWFQMMSGWDESAVTG
jgi:hypothetical protein